MKVLIALLACVAVSHAAFTANLQQRVQPALSRGLFKVRLASGRSDFQTDLVDSLNAHLQDLLAQANAAVSTGTAIADSVLLDIQNTYDQLAAVGSQLVDVGSSAWNHVTETLGNAWDSIWGSLSGLFGGSKQGKDLSSILDLVQGLGFDLSSVQNVINTLIGHAQNVISQLSENDIVAAIINQLTGSRALGNIFSQLQAAGQSALNSLVSAGQNALAQVVENIKPTLVQIQNVAQQFVAEGQQYAQDVLAQAHAAGQQLLATLAPHAANFQAAYNQIASLVNQLTN